ncbi:MAG: thioredoxin family protein [Chlamydiota bacterium]|nr:thioredoxin family protein [Chlamydiota bacterium]
MINIFSYAKVITPILLSYSMLTATPLMSNETTGFKNPVRDIDQTSFHSFSSNKIVVVDYYADWCGPCKRLKPIYEDLAYTYSDKAFFGRVNIDKSRSLAKSHNISKLPTLVIYEDGKEISRRGPGSKHEIKAWIESNIK